MKINIVENIVISLVMQDLPPDDDFLSKRKKDDQTGNVKSRFSIKLEFEKTCFFVTFNLKLLTGEDKGIIAEFKSKFVTDVPIDDEFINSNFPYVNAPAISYPFLRTFISNLTLNSGYSPVMLPSVNFVALKDKTRKSNNVDIPENKEDA